MSHPVVETKIELVTEAIEALVLASHVAVSSTDADRDLNYQNLKDARETVKNCLREFLQPTLRVIQTQRDDKVGDVTRTLTKTVVEDSRGFPGGSNARPHLA